MNKTKKVCTLLLALALVVGIAWLLPTATEAVAAMNLIEVTITDADGNEKTVEFGVGKDYCIEIGTADELYAFAELVNSDRYPNIDAKLTADIVVNPGTFDSDGNYTAKDGETRRTWTPIGDITNCYAYTGTFDGQGHTISGLYLNDSSTDNVGLFGYVLSGTVQNVGVINSYFCGRNNVGGVVGEASDCQILNCYNTGTVSGSVNVGGVAGAATDSQILNCYNTGAVSGSGCVGGLAGYNTGTVTECYNTGDVTGNESVGGLVGYHWKGAITNCYNTGDVTGSDWYVGGLIAYFTEAVLTNGYNTGTVSGEQKFVGGLVGRNSSCTITNCYYLTDCAEDGDDTIQFGIGNNTQGSATADTTGSTTGVTTGQLASGEVTYLLSQGCTVNSTTYSGDAWKQTLGEGGDSYPTLDSTHGTVYRIAIFAGCNDTTELISTTYSSTQSENTYGDHTGGTATCKTQAECEVCNQPYGDYADHVFTDGCNGFCTVCGGYQPATLNGDNVYEISNAGQLYWFAGLVNGTLTDVTQNKAANAILLADIDLNGAAWTPLGSTGLYYSTTTYSDKGYEGTFDGNNHTISNFKVTATTNSKLTWGFVGTLSGTVKNLTVADMTFDGSSASDLRAGGIAGQIIGGTVSNCAAIRVNVDVGSYVTGGIAACNYGGTIENCIAYNCAVSGTSGRYGHIVGDNRGDGGDTDRPGNVINCYTNGTTPTGGRTGSGTCEATCVTDAWFANGYVAVKLGSAWGQNIDNGETNPGYPIPGGAAVYTGGCPSYSNTENSNTHSYQNGICSVCGAYEPAEKNEDGVYEISNAGQLLWFAQQVNNGNNTISAVLTADIKLDGLTWTPIGNAGNKFAGTFDGNNKTISGFTMTITDAGAHGLFGYINGATIKNFTISGAVTTDIATDEGDYFFGVVGWSTNNVTISNVHSSVSFTDNGTVRFDYVGGILGFHGNGSDSLTIEKCSYSGIITIGADCPSSCVSGILAYSYAGRATYINNCLFSGEITVKYNDCISVGGILGYYRLYSIYITNCASVGTITVAESNTTAGAIAGWLISHSYANSRVTNNYYLEGATPFGSKSGDESIVNGYKGQTVAGSATAATSDELTSGKIAYLLNASSSDGVWKQTIGTDDHPSFTGQTVYTYTNCADKAAYANEQLEDRIHGEYPNGICSVCGNDYQPCEGQGTEESPYLIANAGQLYWFAAQVNSGNTSINAVLTANIVVNEGTMSADSTNVRSWTPIGNSSKNYAGTFDGDGHTVSGLYFSGNSTSYVGLFGNVASNGTVQNVGVVNSYFYVSYKGAIVGGVVGENDGEVTNCYNTGTVNVSGRYVGGVVGVNSGTVKNCYNTGTVSNSYDSSSSTKPCVGGIVGYNYSGTVDGCYNTGTVSYLGDKEWPVGGVVGYNKGTVTDCYNSGNVSGTTYVGGVAGQNDGGTVEKCYNTGEVSGTKYVGGVVGENTKGTVEKCYNTNTVSGTGDGIGGVVGVNCNTTNATGTVTNCYNTGTVSGTKYVGGVVGGNCGVIKTTGIVTNCYNTGTVSGTAYVGGVVGDNDTDNDVTRIVKNCFYLTGYAKDGNGTVQNGIGNATQGNTTADTEDVTTGVTTDQLKSGEVAYLLSQGCTVGEGDDAVTYPGTAWKQTLDGKTYPGFTGDTVYYGYASCTAEEMSYSNTKLDTVKNNHDYSDSWSYDSTGHWHKCNNCEAITDKDDHSGGTATCTEQAVCEVCDQPYGEVDSTNHGETEVKNAKDATCTEEGYTGDACCKDCGAVLTEGKAIEKLAHTGGTATCISKAKCTECGNEYGELDSTNHGETEVKNAKEATSTEEGYTGDTCCKDCGTVLAQGEAIETLKTADLDTKGGNAWVWIVVGVVAAGGVGCGVFFFLKKKKIIK